MKKTFLIVVSIWAALPGVARSAAATVEDAISEMPCQAEIRHQLDEWSVTGSTFELPAAPGQGVLYRLPTHTIGSWVLLLRDKAEARASLVSATKVNHVSWVAGCRMNSRTEIAAQDARPGDFSDSDLVALLEENDMGLVYVWSPHMLLSVDGVNELERISEDLGIGFIALLDPNADPVFAKDTARESGLPEGALRRATSVELLFRDMFVHSPSLLMYHKGKIVGAAVPGYRKPEHYRQTIARRLEF